MWRTLSSEEIIQLAKEYEALEVWKKIRQVILKTYGEQAYKVDLMAGEEYNDERMIDIVSTFAIYDREGSRLGPNLSLPFWEEQLAFWQNRHPLQIQLREAYPDLPAYPDPVSFESEQDQDLWLLDMADDTMKHIFPSYTGSFLLDTPPPISFPEVYANEPE